jgi:signal transduction histidine kinase
VVAAERVAAAWQRQWGEGAPTGEVVDALEALTLAIARRQADPEAPLDAPVRSVLGQRLLELVRAEVMRGWAEHGATPAEVLAVLSAIDQVRQAIGPDWLTDFASRLTGPDGLEILVEMAHDLRSPLTSILFLAETLQRGQSGPVTDVQRRQLALIYGAALGLSTVASDIVELARGGDQLVEQEPAPFSVGAVLESVRDIVRPIAEERALAVRLLPPPGDDRQGHPVALSRVLLNLTTNALKFTEVGFVEIVTRELGSARVEFGVRDSGKGIDPKIVDSLFQPLRRAVGRSGRSFSQTGLGLLMCRKLIEAMGSELQVETRPGWGTRFSFILDLPRCPEPGAGHLAERAAARRARHLRVARPLGDARAPVLSGRATGEYARVGARTVLPLSPDA